MAGTILDHLSARELSAPLLVRARWDEPALCAWLFRLDAGDDGPEYDLHLRAERVAEGLFPPPRARLSLLLESGRARRYEELHGGGSFATLERGLELLSGRRLRALVPGRLPRHEALLTVDRVAAWGLEELIFLEEESALAPEASAQLAQAGASLGLRVRTLPRAPVQMRSACALASEIVERGIGVGRVLC